MVALHLFPACHPREVPAVCSSCDGILAIVTHRRCICAVGTSPSAGTQEICVRSPGGSDAFTVFSGLLKSCAAAVRYLFLVLMVCTSTLALAQQTFVNGSFEIPALG